MASDDAYPKDAILVASHTLWFPLPACNRLLFEGFLGEIVDETLVIKVFDFDRASFDDPLGAHITCRAEAH